MQQSRRFAALLLYRRSGKAGPSALSWLVPLRQPADRDSHRICRSQCSLLVGNFFRERGNYLYGEPFAFIRFRFSHPPLFKRWRRPHWGSLSPPKGGLANVSSCSNVARSPSLVCAQVHSGLRLRLTHRRIFLVSQLPQRGAPFSAPAAIFVPSPPPELLSNSYG